MGSRTRQERILKLPKGSKSICGPFKTMSQNRLRAAKLFLKSVKIKERDKKFKTMIIILENL